MPSFSKPTPEEIDKAIALLVAPELCRVFFGKLENPEWVSPLAQKGYFSAPPVPIESAGGVAHPAWPASEYLVRMAPFAAEDVFKALASVDTSNARVISNICETAVALPADLAAKLSEKIRKAIKDGVWVQLYAEQAANLIVKLAREGQASVAVELADTLFAVKAHKTLSHTPVGIIDVHSYGETLPKVVRALGETDAARAMGWTRALLKRAASYHLGPDTREEFDDVSWVWRPAIEDHEQNRRHDIADCIVTAMRDLAVQVTDTGAWPLRTTVDFLEAGSKLVLSRIGLHLVRQFADRDMDLAVQKMLSRELFNSHQCRHEYAMLLQDRFVMLPPDGQQTILGWINEGLDREETRRILVANLGERFREKYIDKRIHAWQRDCLSWFRESLPPEWRQRYETLVAEVGQPKHADLAFWAEVGGEDAEPPESLPNLAAMDTPSLVAYLKTWRPDPQDYWGRSLADLAGRLASAVQENPGRFSAEAPSFADLHPTYVTRILSEITVAVQNHRTVSIEPVLNLCLAVVAKPIELPAEDRVGGDPFDSDPSWEYARNEVVRVVERFCDADVPMALREKLWACLARLEAAPDKSYIADEPTEDIRLATWLDHACNNPKARWLHAVIRYAIWVKKQTLAATKEERSTVGLGVAPEAAAVLEALLNPERDLSPAVRSEYGQDYPALCWLDADWARRHASQIFTLAGDHASQGWAAWNSYLVANRVYSDVLEAIRDVYKQAIAGLEPDLHTTGARFNPLPKLAENIVVLYGRGLIPLEQPDGLLRQFFLKVPPQVRGHAIETVGSSLDGPHDVPRQVLERFVALWEWFWATFVQGQASPTLTKELASFGWWLTCGKFDDKWCLDRLVQVMQLSPEAQPEQEVMKRLAELAPTHPLQVVTCADRLVRGDTEGWRLYSWRESLVTLLGTVLHLDNQDARRMALELANRLGCRGFHEFGQIVKDASPPQGG